MVCPFHPAMMHWSRLVILSEKLFRQIATAMAVLMLACLVGLLIEQYQRVAAANQTLAVEQQNLRDIGTFNNEVALFSQLLVRKEEFLLTLNELNRRATSETEILVAFPDRVMIGSIGQPTEREDSELLTGIEIYVYVPAGSHQLKVHSDFLKAIDRGPKDELKQPSTVVFESQLEAETIHRFRFDVEQQDESEFLTIANNGKTAFRIPIHGKNNKLDSGFSYRPFRCFALGHPSQFGFKIVRSGANVNAWCFDPTNQIQLHWFDDQYTHSDDSIIKRLTLQVISEAPPITSLVDEHYVAHKLARDFEVESVFKPTARSEMFEFSDEMIEAMESDLPDESKGLKFSEWGRRVYEVQGFRGEPRKLKYLD